MAFSQERTTYFPCIKVENRQTQPQLYGTAYLSVTFTLIGPIACTNAPGSVCSSRSNSREECEPVTRREDPTLCHVHWQFSRERSDRQRTGRNYPRSPA